ncbi:BQ5605_C017g08510 [Microbotryum silenes-dioicae]|uniref:BQ5605_C017g08510 protein n=1 Tax=Microbotryum silenes-dioicae TaxID=796604 RepID=A0A2X0LV48_9BASI|nr:BQ5605_C017g08510 [Microbotryum silenes-dioicae]
MESDLDEAALQDYNDYEHSGADDEEARAYNLTVIFILQGKCFRPRIRLK